MARAIEVRTGALGAEHSDVGQTMYRLARVYHAQKRFAEARPLHQRALEIRRNAQGPEHPEVVQSLNGIAQMWDAQGNWKRSVAAARKARDIVISRAQKGALGLGGGAQESGRLEIAQGREAFSQLVRSLWSVGQKQPRRRTELLRESYLGAHWAEQTEASAAVTQMSIRQAKGQGSLATLIRERQDWFTSGRLRIGSSTARSPKPPAETWRRSGSCGPRSRRSKAVSRHRPNAETRVHRLLSVFRILMLSRWRKPKSCSGRRGAGSVHGQRKDVFIWAVTKRASRWVRSPLAAKQLSERVAALRCGLDYTAWNDDRCSAALQREPKNGNRGRPDGQCPAVRHNARIRALRCPASAGRGTHTRKAAACCALRAAQQPAVHMSW